MVADRDFNSDAPDTTSFVHTQFSLKAVADLTSNVTGVLELANGVGPAGSIIGNGPSGVVFEQGYIEAKEAFRKELTLKAGVFDVGYDLRGNGDALMLDLKHNVLTRDLDVGGWMARWDAKPVTVDGFMLTICDAGTVGTNASLLGVVVDYEKEKNLFRAMLGYLNSEGATLIPGGNDANAFLLGVGADYFVLNGDLELYGELGFQTGRYIKAGTDVDHTGLAFYLGAKYNFKVNYKPYLDFSFWYLSGADPASATDMDEWYMLGNLNQTLVVEDTVYGLGLIGNYWTIRLEGGLAPTDNTTVSASFNLFEEVETAAGADSDLGIEFDIKGTYAYTSDLSLGLGIGIFMPGDAATGGGAATDDPTFLLDLETALKF
jgi:hypothetical protein